jgi:hypothetical protein
MHYYLQINSRKRRNTKGRNAAAFCGSAAATGLVHRAFPWASGVNIFKI